MNPLPKFVDPRNARSLLIEHGWEHWGQGDLDNCLDWFGLEPTSERALTLRSPPEAPDVSIYVIVDTVPGIHPVKVGISWKPEDRRKVLERERGRSLRVAYRSRGFIRTEAMRIERWAHALLNPWALGREWFLCDPRDAIETVVACGGDPGDVI